MSDEKWTEYEQKKQALLSGTPQSFTSRELLKLMYEAYATRMQPGTLKSQQDFLASFGFSDSDYREYAQRNGNPRKLPERHWQNLAKYALPGTAAAHPLYWSQLSFELQNIDSIPLMTPPSQETNYQKALWENKVTTGPAGLCVTYSLRR